MFLLYHHKLSWSSDLPRGLARVGSLEVKVGIALPARHEGCEVVNCTGLRAQNSSG